jgi:hypothetical protein
VDYQDFRVLVAAGPDGPEVRVLGSPAGQGARAPFVCPLGGRDLARLERIFAGGSIGAPAESRRHLRPALAGADDRFLVETGERLFRSLFPGEVRDRFLQSRERAPGGLRIRLQLELDFGGNPDGDPEGGSEPRLERDRERRPADPVPLHRLPWELLREPGRDRIPLALQRRTPVVRYLDVAGHAELPEPPAPLGVLVVAPRPSDAPALALDLEAGELRQELAGRSDVAVRVLDPPTLEGLTEALRGGDVHVLHFMGHGELDPAAGEGSLVLEDRMGRSRRLGAPRLVEHLGDFLPPLRLVFLNACRTAEAVPGVPWAGVATALVRAGVPAVIAMQFPVTDRAAVTFAASVYRRLAAGAPVDEAVTDGRLAIRGTHPGSPEWATPALFLRVPDGRVFAAPEPPAAAEPASPQGSDGGRWRRWGPFAAALAGVALAVVLGWRGVTGLPGTGDDGSAGGDPAPAEELREAVPTAAGLLHTGSRRASRAKEGDGGPAGEDRPEKRSERDRPEGGAVPGVLELVAGRPVFLPEISAHITAELITFRGKELVRVTLSPTGGPSQARLGVPGNTLELGTGEQPLNVELVAADRDAGTIRLLVRR